MFKRLMGFPFPLHCKPLLALRQVCCELFGRAPTTSSASTGLTTLPTSLRVLRCGPQGGFLPKASIREQGHLFPDRFDRGGRFGKVGIGQAKQVPWDFWFIGSLIFLIGGFDLGTPLVRGKAPNTPCPQNRH